MRGGRYFDVDRARRNGWHCRRKWLGQKRIEPGDFRPGSSAAGKNRQWASHVRRPRSATAPRATIGRHSWQPHRYDLSRSDDITQSVSRPSDTNLPKLLGYICITRMRRPNVMRLKCSSESAFPRRARRMDDYPHQFSGGMRQRVMIAMALACKPALLIADEPTTALDVTIQAQILELLKQLQQAEGTAIVLITHDLGVVANICRRVNVMYAGRFVEESPVDDLFARPRHPYTRGLLDSITRLDSAKQTLTPIQGQPPDLMNVPSGCAFPPALPEHRRVTVRKKCHRFILASRTCATPASIRCGSKKTARSQIISPARCSPCPSTCAAPRAPSTLPSGC